MNDLISIIVPVYNVEKYLSRCIESIINQSYYNLELILIDDGSKDNCADICDEYAKNEKRIIVVHKNNEGVAAARNNGLSLSRGEYITFVDSDDYLSLDAIEVLYNRIVSDKSDLVIGKHIDIYDNGNTNDSFCSWMEDEILLQQDFLKAMGNKKYYPVANCMKLYKRKLFNGITYPDLECGEDVWVFPQIIDKCEKISVVNKTLYYYYQRTNSIVHQKSEKAKMDDLRAVLNLSKYFLNKNIIKSAKKWFAIGVNKAYAINNKSQRLQIINQYFGFFAGMKMIRNCEIKTILKWFSLYSEFLNSVLHFIFDKNKKGNPNA